MEKKYKSVEEFSVRTLEFGGLGAALQALRLPFGKDVRSYSSSYCEEYPFRSGDGGKEMFKYSVYISPVDGKDVQLLQVLVGRGDEHAKVLRGVVVWAEINAPRYWWQEMATYRIGCDCLSSNSTMHQECHGMSEDELVEAKEHIEEGLMQKRVYTFSYQALRRIYFQRRNHRLPQWRKFCEGIEALPFAKEFITIEK